MRRLDDYRDFWLAKFTDDGEVREGWDSWDWSAKRFSGCKKTSTRNAHTAGRSRPRRPGRARA